MTYALCVIQGERIALSANLMIEVSRREWTRELGADAWDQAWYCLDAPDVIPSGSVIASPDEEQDLALVPLVEPSFTYRP